MATVLLKQLQLVAGLRVGGIKLERFPKFIHPFVRLALLDQGFAQDVMGFFISRSDPQGCAEFRDRFLGLAGS